MWKFRSFAVDITPLKISRDYRNLWLGQLISEAGRQITLVSVYYQVFDITNSSAAVGLVGLFQLSALVVASIASQWIVDAVDRRKLLLLTQIGQVCSTSILLFAAIRENPPVVVIYAVVTLSAFLSGIEGPNRSAITPRLVGRKQLSAALALNQVMWNSTMIVGPAIGGFLLGSFGLKWAYGVDVVTYAASIFAAYSIKPLPPEVSEIPSRGWQGIKAGMTFLRGKRTIQSTFIVDLIAMTFGSPRALYPVLAATKFGGGPEVVGLLFAAPAMGALLASVTSGWVRHVQRQGLAVLVSVAVWGFGIAGFGLVSRNLMVAMAFLALAGGADVISAVFRSTIMHMSVPDNLRGRLSAIHILVVTGGPRLGDFESGVVAEAINPTFSVTSGGLACIAGVFVLRFLIPEFAKYRPPEEINK